MRHGTKGQQVCKKRLMKEARMLPLPCLTYRISHVQYISTTWMSLRCGARYVSRCRCSSLSAQRVVAVRPPRRSGRNGRLDAGREVYKRERRDWTASSDHRRCLGRCNASSSAYSTCVDGRTNRWAGDHSNLSIAVHPHLAVAQKSNST